jgi:hypothetical protein
MLGKAFHVGDGGEVGEMSRHGASLDARLVFGVVTDPVRQALVASEAFRELRARIQGGRASVALFVGAGMAIPCGMPSWSGLLTKLAPPAFAGAVGTLLAACDFEGAAEIVQGALGRTVFRERLVDTFSTGWTARGPILRLPQLDVDFIVSTNFDRVLEHVFDGAGTPFSAIASGANARVLEDALERGSRCLFKIHGDLGDTANFILTASEYATHYAADSELRRFLVRTLANRTLLFLGCSLRSDRTLELMLEAAAQTYAPAHHFAIVERDPDEAAQDGCLGSRNIRPIYYPKGQHGLVESLLVELLLANEERAPSRILARRPKDSIACMDLGSEASFVSFATELSEIGYVPDARGRQIVPSALSFTAPFRFSVGSGHQGEHVVRNYKRDLGLGKRYLPHGRIVAAEDAACMMLRSLAQNVRDYWGEEPGPVLMAVPANFTLAQRNGLLQAARDAGLQVMRLFAEPVAAVVNLVDLVNSVEWHVVLVVDLGGGTLDLALVEVGDGVFDVQAIAGDNEFGGADLDTALARHCVSMIEQRLGRRLPLAGPDAHREAERVKIALDMHDSVDFVIPDVETLDGGTRDERFTVHWQDLEHLFAPWTRRLADCVSVLERRNAAAMQKVDTVMLAGLGTRARPIREWIRQRFSDKVVRAEYERNAVARGLALYSIVLARPASYVILDMLSRDIGILCSEVIEADDDAFDVDDRRFS